MPSTSVFLSAIGHPSIVPRIASTNGHSPSSQVAEAMTVSLPIGKCRYSGPPRTDSATHHLRGQHSSVPSCSPLPSAPWYSPVPGLVLEQVCVPDCLD